MHYPRDTCMVCKEREPTVEALFALGEGHAWICPDCFPDWKAKNVEGLLGTKAVEHGIARRRFTDELSPVAQCEGLYLAAPHGDLTYSGRKTAMVKHRPFPELDNKSFILVSGGKAYGTVEVGLGEEIALAEFDERFDAHRITAKERKRWWPEGEKFWYYPFEAFHPLSRPVKAEVPPGVQTFLDEVKLLGESDELWTASHPPPCAKDWTATKRRKCVQAANAEYRESKDSEKAICACTEAVGKNEEEETPVESKELRLDQRAGVVRKTWDELLAPTWNYVTEVDDKHIIVEEEDKYFKVGYTWSGDTPTFAPRDKWTEVVRPWVAVKTFVGKDGEDWLLTWTTNAFKDREDELFTTQSILDYVERHEDEDTKGRFMFWHLPGTDFGDIKVQAVTGRFLVEAGPIDQDEKGQAFAAFFKAYPDGHPTLAPTGWGASHGYLYMEEDRRDQVYEWFEKKETSVLPEMAAANPYNPSLEVLQMNDKQRKLLQEIGGVSLVNYVEETGEKLTSVLEKTGVEFKEASEVAPDAEKVSASGATTKESEATPVESPVSGGGGSEDSKAAQMAELAEALQLGGLSELLSAQTTALKALTAKMDAVEARLDGVEVTDEQKLAEKEAALPRYFWFQGSEVAETAMKEGDPIMQRQPGAPPRALAAAAARLGQATA